MIPHAAAEALPRGKGVGAVRALIVEDDAASAGHLAELLHEMGYPETRVADSVAAALRHAVESVPTVIFVDVELPDLSGYDAARLLHQHPQLQQARLIALTDSREHPGRERARVAGFERYLVKPVTIAALQEVLQMASR